MNEKFTTVQFNYQLWYKRNEEKDPLTHLQEDCFKWMENVPPISLRYGPEDANYPDMRKIHRSLPPGLL